MLEVVASERRSKEPAGDVNELFERLLPYVGSTVLIEHFDADGVAYRRISGVLGRMEAQSELSAIGVALGGESSDSLALRCRVSAVIDGATRIIHSGNTLELDPESTHWLLIRRTTSMADREFIYFPVESREINGQLENLAQFYKNHMRLRKLVQVPPSKLKDLAKALSFDEKQIKKVRFNEVKFAVKSRKMEEADWYFQGDSFFEG